MSHMKKHSRIGWTLKDMRKSNYELGKIILAKFGETRIRQSYWIDKPKDHLEVVGHTALKFKDIDREGNLRK